MTVVQIFPEQMIRFPGRRRRYFVRVVSENGETLAVSEAYATRWSARRAARKNFPGLLVIEVRE